MSFENRAAIEVVHCKDGTLAPFLSFSNRTEYTYPNLYSGQPNRIPLYLSIIYLKSKERLEEEMITHFDLVPLKIGHPPRGEKWISFFSREDHHLDGFFSFGNGVRLK